MDGVDGGFILAFGRLYAAAREQQINITPKAEENLYQMLKATYGTPKGFHIDCKQRLTNFQLKNRLPKTWSDNCLAPIFLEDYMKWEKYEGHRMPILEYTPTYAGI
jgi:hypothetical protein